MLKERNGKLLYRRVLSLDMAEKVRKYGRSEVENAIIFIDEIDKITHTGCGKETDDMGYDIMRFMMNLTDPRNNIRLNNGLGKNGEKTPLLQIVGGYLRINVLLFIGTKRSITSKTNSIDQV